MRDLFIIGVLLAGVALVRGRIATWPLTTPMIFVGAGMLLSPEVLDAFRIDLTDESVAIVAELTLALLLFSDASRISASELRRSLGLPARLLGIGLPLTIAMGTAVTALLLTDLSWEEAALVAAILAPTDAALGQAVVTNERVPLRIRQTLNVESGLNDGLVVPVVTVFAVLAAGNEIDGPWHLFGEAVLEIAIGVGLGLGAALVLSRAMPWAEQRGWTDLEGLRLVTFGAAIAAYAGSTIAGGNGFIAAFVCGLALHRLIGEHTAEHAELVEDLGQIGASATFVMFGVLMAWPALDALSWPVVACAIATLTVGRMLPVAIALTGTGLRAPSVVFMGWFGPRGLASMLFGLLIVAERGGEADQLFAVITLVVLASVLAHGVTAGPGAAAYARWFESHPARPGGLMPEARSATEARLRWRRP